MKLEVITRDMRSEIAQSAVMAQELVDQGIAVMLAMISSPSVAIDAEEPFSRQIARPTT